MTRPPAWERPSVQFLKDVALVGAGPGLGGDAVDVHYLEALGKAHLGALFGQLDADAADAGVAGHFLAAQLAHGGDGVAHTVLAEFGPALAGQVVGGVGGVNVVQLGGNCLGARRNGPGVLAHAKDGVAVVAAGGAAPVDMGRFPTVPPQYGRRCSPAAAPGRRCWRWVGSFQQFWMDTKAPSSLT